MTTPPTPPTNPYTQAGSPPYPQGQPGGEVPPPHYPQAIPQNPYQLIPPPADRSTNGFAIASLVLGIIGGILLSVIFGIVALTQIKNRGQKGKGLAIAGLACSGAWVLGIVAVIAVA